MFSLDISKWKDGCSIENLKGEGLVHLYLKATEGMNYTDPCLNKFYSEANRLGIPVGFYHFATANPDIEGQAVDFWNSVKDKPCQLKYCLDMEKELDYNNFVYRFINKFKEVSGLGDDSIVIYANGYYARDNFNEDIKNKYPLWIAHYGVTPGEYMSTGFKTIAGHQYSENEVHQGTEFDSNIFYSSIMLDNSVVANNIAVQQPIGGKIAELQAICGVTVDNIYGPQTDNAIRGLLAGLPYHTPELTSWIQLRLGLNPDGIFGQETDKAIREWQANHGLAVDGLAGYNTIKSLALA